MRELSYNEIVVLNPLQTKYQLLTPRVLIPLYAAINDGIYTLNRAERTKNFVGVLGIAVGVLVLLFVILFGIFGLLLTLSVSFFIYKMIGLSLSLVFIAGGIFGIIKLVKVGKRLNVNRLEGDLVVPWSEVKTISVVNIRQEVVSSSFISPDFKEIGDWHVITVDGRDITIPNVDDPINKLNYVKAKFNLRF
ncbi:conjugative plasmid protein (pARN3) [Acidianus sp. HS-5]|uniref:conjugative plasmid protein (pARN3) n=1 Tax=Acidianus sp. HS-5 TaxID=2886040 RepID=UPI001F1C54B0|nr:conjugative plasmid protein (pARN3) [Acidianus sp. HS-5]